MGSLGELIGAFAVLITLIYLTAQMRQNTNAIKSSMVTELTTQFLTNSLAVSSNPVLADLIIRVHSGKYNALTAVEKSQLSHWATAALKAGDFAHYQWIKETWMMTSGPVRPIH